MKDTTVDEKLIPKGYKSSALGVIPEDWEVKKLGQMLEKIVGGGTPSRDNVVFWNGNIPWATVKDLSNFTAFKTKEYITDEGLKKSASNIIPKNTLITATRMALGKVVRFQVDVAINQDLKAVFPKSDLDSQFLYYWFQSNSKAIIDLGNGSTVKGIVLNDLKNIKFLKVPIKEQKVIADCLSTWDKAIEKLNQLIVQKELCKKGLMQELLSGKKRLRGFEEKSGFVVSEFGLKVPKDWKIVNVDEIFNDRTEKSSDQSLYPLYSLTIAEGLTVKTDRYERSFLLKDLEGNQYKIVYPEDILFNPMNLRFGAIAKSNANMKVLVSAYYNTIYKSSDLIIVDYYIALFKTEIYNNFYQRIAIGSLEEKKRVHLSNFMKLEVPLPTLEEQIAIADVLQSAIKEIQLLKNKLEQLKMQKKGLMQVLLTGKKRLRY